MHQRWLKTMDERAVLCRVRVGTLDRTYRKVRNRVKALTEAHPDLADELRALHVEMGQLYDDAHAYSKGVPLSDREFKRMVEADPKLTLPRWAEDRR